MQGMQRKNWLLSAIACFAVCLSSVIAKPVELELQDGTIWQGELGQTVTVIFKERGKRQEVTGEFTHSGSTYIQVHGEIIDLMTIVSISGGGSTDVETNDSPEEFVQSNTTESIGVTKPQPPKMPGNADIPNYFFILPMKKGVGSYFRPSELIELAAYLDENYGPGQTIVLKVNSGGGYGYIWAKCRDAIFDIRKRHRVVAWIAINATSAAAMTVYCCDEIYYQSLGHVGSCTGYRGDPNNVMPPAEMQVMITDVEKCIVRSSRPVQLAGCLFEAWRMLAYTKDPVTGIYTYYDETDDIPGNATMLSDNTENLNLGAQEAVDAGLADGIADTEADLAALLDIEDWVEIDDRYGIKLFEAWDKTMTNFEDEVWRDLIERFVQGQIEGETEKQILSKQIKAGKELLRWTRKLGDSWTYQYAILEFPKYVNKQFETAADATDHIHRMIAELKHQLRLIDDD
jgi:hypothetical protein